jgi:hypothetical protein
MNAQGLETLALHGRYGDNLIGHLTPGEVVLPRPIADDPVLKRQLFDAFERHEINPYQYTVGHYENSINPLTGVPEFGFFKKVGKFLKKAAPIIGQVIGFTMGGPAGAAIGGGIGGAVKHGNVQGAIQGAAQGYIGGNIAVGMGATPGGGIGSLIGKGKVGAENLWTLGANPTDAGGIGGLLQNLGASGADMLGRGPAEGVAIPKLSDQWAGLGTLQKVGTGALGMAALGGFNQQQEDVAMPPPSGELGGYLQNPLTPATIPTQYVGATGVPTSMGAGIGAGGIDPATAAYVDATLRDDQYSDLMFPEFEQYSYRHGGQAKLLDGSSTPELDLRNTGGSISDPQGSGDQDTVDAKLADGEFVFTKQGVKGIGQGNHQQGIDSLYALMHSGENMAQSMGIGRA